jgi:GNAT superfamily N-acetyltransferase
MNKISTLVISEQLTTSELDWAYAQISQTYWAQGMPRATFDRAVAGSLCVVARDADMPIGFARVVTDRATFAYLCDVIVAKAARGKGAGRAMVKHVLAHADLHGLRRFCLMTRDAHGLYAKFGFTPMPDATPFMQLYDPNVYQPKPA